MFPAKVCIIAGVTLIYYEIVVDTEVSTGILALARGKMGTIQHLHKTSSEPGVISSVSVASFPERKRIEKQQKR